MLSRIHKHILLLGCLLFVGWAHAQTALYNSGNLRIHNGGQLGFHTNLVNNGSFDENRGLAGFYGENMLSISGALSPLLFDAEFALQAGLELQLPLGIANNANFILGDVQTPKSLSAPALQFGGTAFYVGASDASKVDGYASVEGQDSFVFPVGDAAQLRPLSMNAEAAVPLARCAYFRENPDSPSAFSPFNTALRPRTVSGISNREFWRLQGDVTTTVALGWNAESGLSEIADDPGQVILVGWSKSENRWLELGQAGLTGNLDSGMLTSAPFVPDDYEVITFGSLSEPTDILTLDNYLLTPNGDGVNDFLEIAELELSPNNMLTLYDRQGLKVFEKQNYRHEFSGVSNVDNLVINREQGLPEGVYFYVVDLYDLGLHYQGFLYLER